MLILVKVAEWSAASVKLSLHNKWLKLSQIKNKAHFQVAVVCFSQVSWKLEYFLIFSFDRRWKQHLYFHFTPIPAQPKIPFFFNTFLICASPNMQQKKSKYPSKFPADH